MNDYKELVAELRKWQTLGDAPVGNGFGVIVDKLTLKQAADAIEQLVKERDEWMEYAKQERKRSIERYHELAVELDRVKKERDAAVADLKSVLASECGLNQCRYCKYQEDDYQCHHDCIPCSEKWGWEWRGVQEDNDEAN